MGEVGGVGGGEPVGRWDHRGEDEGEDREDRGG